VLARANLLRELLEGIVRPALALLDHADGSTSSMPIRPQSAATIARSAKEESVT